MIFDFFERPWVYSLPWTDITASTTVESILCLAAYVLAILFALSIHEFGHAFVAYKCGDSTAKLSGIMTINPIKHIDPLGGIMLILVGFGWAKPVPVNFYNLNNQKRDTILVSLAGIFMNLISAFICTLLYMLLGAFVPAETLANSNFLYLLIYLLYFFLFFSTLIHISLTLFNILPLYPLDGFRVLEGFCSYGNRFVEFLRRYSFILSIAIIVLSYLPIFEPFTWYISTFSNLLLRLFTGFWGLFGL